MKTLILLPFAAAVLLAGCAQQPPVVVERHHHHYTRPSQDYPSKASPSVRSEAPSEFRAVEKAD